jgi:hypothetical protein
MALSPDITDASLIKGRSKPTLTRWIQVVLIRINIETTDDWGFIYATY